jgi:AraC family ethanolamine operon transcriptional activator
MACGPFSGTLEHVEIAGGLKLFRERTNIKLSEHFVTPVKCISLAMPLAGSAPVHFSGLEAAPGDIISFRPGEAYHLECRGAFDVLGIEIDDLDDVPVLHTAAPAEIIPAHATSTAPWTSVIGKLVRANACGEAPTVDRQFAAALKYRCQSLLQRRANTRHTIPRASKSRLVAQARALIAANCHEQFSIKDLATTLNTSTRTLEYSFQEILAVSPATYIKIVRLHEARRAIRRAGPGTKVTDIAVTWGFWHFGRFAGDYRKLFGELPSDTKTARQGMNS